MMIFVSETNKTRQNVVGRAVTNYNLDVEIYASGIKMFEFNNKSHGGRLHALFYERIRVINSLISSVKYDGNTQQ